MAETITRAQLSEAIYQEVGFARSLLGYKLPDGRIQLIDGHLRAEHDPDALITVELVEPTAARRDARARQLLADLAVGVRIP